MNHTAAVRWPATLITTLILTGCAGYQSLDSAVAPTREPGTASTGADAASRTPAAGTVARELWQVYERYRGTPYRYGGTSASGFDCSGFILTAYREGLHRDLPRTTAQMLARGQFVRRDQLEAGDILFFRIAGKEQHAGLYIGDGTFVHSATSVGVTASSLDSRYWRNRYSQARRFLIR